MPKRKLLSQMSKRHYRRLKRKTCDIAMRESMNKSSTDSNNTSNAMTSINRNVDQTTNITLTKELSQQYSNILDIYNENVTCNDSNFTLEESNYTFVKQSIAEDLLCPTASTSNNEKNNGYTKLSSALSIKDDLINWAVQYQISHTAVTALLQIVRKHNFDICFPKNCKSLLKTPRHTNIRKVAPGEYFHNGLITGILEFLRNSPDNIDLIEVQISIDGLPISNSSTNQLWPILGSVAPSFNTVFIIGCYFGPKKPYNCNEFLRDFVDEAQILVTNGFGYREKHISISIHSLIADAPAKSFVTATKGHTGYFSCAKCTTEGKYIAQRMCFSDINCLKRTDDSFAKQTQKEHHTGQSILLNIPNFGLISKVPLDYMHLVCIGAVKKILNFLLSGPLNVRLPTQAINNISKLLIEMQTSIPVEFVRKPRELHFLSLWKATESRQFLLYTGPIIIKNHTNKDVYKNFLTLHVAIRLLCSPDLSFISYAESLLEHFVQSFTILYGPQNISHNIHALIHLADDVRTLGTLDTFSAFRYENYLRKIKQLIRKAELPLQQIHNRLTEVGYCLPFQEKHRKIGVCGIHNAGPTLPGINGPQYLTFVGTDFTLSIHKPNNCCGLNDGSIVMIENIVTTSTNDLCIIGRQFINLSNFYTKPCNSSLLGIYTSNGCGALSSWPITLVTMKYVKLDICNSTFVLLPLLHTEKI